MAGAIVTPECLLAVTRSHVAFHGPQPMFLCFTEGTIWMHARRRRVSDFQLHRFAFLERAADLLGVDEAA